MTGRKRRPQRTCVVCQTVTDKRSLTRVVRMPDGGVRIDPTGKLPGRGAYLCDRPDCWQKAASGNALERALRTRLTAEERETITAHGVDLRPHAENVT
jgi:predicted RNA-binding protein YlxR (DUF448 family)